MPPKFMRDIQRTLLENIKNHHIHLPLRGYHPLWPGFPAKFEYLDLGVNEPVTPHLPFLSEGIRIALYRVRSPLITVSLLISFPAGTKMLQSPAFPIITDHSEE